MLELKGIDHVYVSNRAAAAQWYADVLGLKPVEKFSSWATPTGPLVVADAAESLHLALFEGQHPPESIAAFGVDAEHFDAWRDHLSAQGLEVRVADHDMAWSLYFDDPDGNGYEITSYGYCPQV